MIEGKIQWHPAFSAALRISTIRVGLIRETEEKGEEITCIIQQLKEKNER